MKRTMLFISIFMCLFGIVSAMAQNPVLSPYKGGHLRFSLMKQICNVDRPAVVCGAASFGFKASNAILFKFCSRIIKPQNSDSILMSRNNKFKNNEKIKCAIFDYLSDVPFCKLCIGSG